VSQSWPRGEVAPWKSNQGTTQRCSTGALVPDTTAGLYGYSEAGGRYLSTEKSKETTACKAYVGLSGSPKESDGDGEAFEVWRKFARGDTGQRLNLTFAIALAPDPVHTHLSLAFDRATDAVRAGAQDEFYDFDSSWLPWHYTHPAFRYGGRKQERLCRWTRSDCGW
jgi:hypothetical protein